MYQSSNVFIYTWQQKKRIIFITYLTCETIIKLISNDIDMFGRTHALVPGHFFPRYTVN